MELTQDNENQSGVVTVPMDEFMEHCFKTATEGLTAEQVEEVCVWWKGGVPKGFWDSVSRPAYERIHTLIGWGLG